MPTVTDEYVSIRDSLFIINKLPMSRQKALVITKLEEALMWLHDLESKGLNIPQPVPTGSN